jgi:hypothetical protein
LFEVAEGNAVLRRQVPASASVMVRPSAWMRPLAKSAVSPSKPSFSPTLRRRLTHAAYTPAVELAAPHWPPEPAEAG